MRWPVLSLIVMSLTVAGCTEPTPTEDEVVEKDRPASTPLPDAVAIHERFLLAEGSSFITQWKVDPRATAATVSLGLTAPSSAVGLITDTCITVTLEPLAPEENSTEGGDHGSGSSTADAGTAPPGEPLCRMGTLQAGASPPRFATDRMAAGVWSLSIESLPSVTEFWLDVEVRYEETA